jgi:hypothetical protein
MQLSMLNIVNKFIFSILQLIFYRTHYFIFQAGQVINLISSPVFNRIAQIFKRLTQSITCFAPLFQLGVQLILLSYRS